METVMALLRKKHQSAKMILNTRIEDEITVGQATDAMVSMLAKRLVSFQPNNF